MTAALNSKAALRRLAPSLRGLRGDFVRISDQAKLVLVDIFAVVSCKGGHMAIFPEEENAVVAASYPVNVLLALDLAQIDILRVLRVRCESLKIVTKPSGHHGRDCFQIFFAAWRVIDRVRQVGTRLLGGCVASYH